MGLLSYSNIFGKKVFIQILEVRGFLRGNNVSYFEAAILSYRNHFAKEIIEEYKDVIEDYLNLGILSASKSNNIIIAEFLIKKGANIKTNDNILFNYIDL